MAEISAYRSVGCIWQPRLNTSGALSCQETTQDGVCIQVQRQPLQDIMDLIQVFVHSFLARLSVTCRVVHLPVEVFSYIIMMPRLPPFFASTHFVFLLFIRESGHFTASRQKQVHICTLDYSQFTRPVIR